MSEDAVSAPVATPADSVGADPGADPRADPGADPGAESGADPGARSSADLVAALVERAALDGSTCLPAAVLAAALRASGIESPGPAAEAAYDAGLVTAYADERLFGHPHWAPLEEQIAEHLVDLMTRSGPTAVRVAIVPRGCPAPATDPDDVVVDDAHRLCLGEAAELLGRLVDTPRDTKLVLVGDPAMPYAPGPGRVLVDLVASGVLPVDDPVEPPSDRPGAGEQAVDGQHLTRLVLSLRAGELPVIDQAQREVVITGAEDARGAVRRAVQLATTSVPRTFGVDADQIVVLAPRIDGSAGVGALRAALDAEGAGEVRTATALSAAPAEAAAVVLVLAGESAGSITRSMLVGAASRAGRHLSVVHQAGPALVTMVAHRPHPPRRTRLASLLADALS